MALIVSLSAIFTLFLVSPDLSPLVHGASVIRPLCPANEHFKSCGTCDPTCANPSPICIQKCTAGCFCLPGLVRYSAGGPCVSSRLCPLKSVPVDLIKPKCPKGVEEVQCLVNPCSTAVCPSHPDAKCVANYCGGCNAEFYVKGELVTCTHSAVSKRATVQDPCERALCAPPNCGRRDRIVLRPGECCAKCESLDI